MSTSAVSKFRAINDFPELVEYLGDELDWPIQTDDFEEMTFDYSAEELGLDAKTAPKFLEIRRLRPLDKDQPWGIFFIRFEESKLPVVALRRLLSKLALKKRSTSNAGDRASWHENDLLLISQTGGQDEKSISFAHFASNPEKTDLPILKVLGWDNDDTGLKIDYVIETLREKLVWPDDPTDSAAWRAQWRDAFTLKNREVIQDSKEMAVRLGQLALAVRTRLREVLAIESEEGPIHKLMSVFKENLISDLDADSFSDMYAQTIAYGLLSARIINPKANTADAAHTQIPITNPFLRDLMETFLNVGGRSHSSGVGLDFDELGINEVVDLLDNTNMEAVLRDFGDRNQKEDPVMHFFEGFLQEYDSKIRKDRGVFYTPQPVVSFIVRSVDEQLRTEFGLEDGLADTTTWGELAARITDLEIPGGTSPSQAFVQILDPATGTGTFPVEVIDLIYKTMTAKWQSQGNREAQIKELWNEYVPKHLLPRLHGYELMMAPYAIAHMKIGLKLYETGYKYKSKARARVYLTNALAPAQDFFGTFAFAIPALAREADAVDSVKRKQTFTVVIGNPPYLGEGGVTSGWIGDLMLDYKKEPGGTAKLVERNPKWLNDLYVQFIRLSSHLIEQGGV
ncbi:N-6 DNA methylase, partial [Pseudomonadales bacterium]|nr:N-6 DNA methylase [Pseudomonadales bacterium]